MPPGQDKGKAPENNEEVITSNNDAHWVETHNAVGVSETTDPAIEVEEEASSDKVNITNKDANWLEAHNNVAEPSKADGTVDAPPLPDEVPPLSGGEEPPLPAEEPPLPTEQLSVQDDGWEPVWNATAQSFYFYNRFTQATQWENPRIPVEGPPGISGALGTSSAPSLPSEPPPSRPAGGYDPAIHGDYDPTAWYAQPAAPEPIAPLAPGEVDPYAATGTFNRFTGRWQAAEISPENFNDENKSKRQMNAFFDVDAAANSHDGRSLKAERSGKKLSRSEVKSFKEKRKQRKEEKRRAWLLD